MNIPNKRDLPEVVAEILIEQHAMRGDINEMRGDINEMRGDINEMRGDINEMRGDINEMRGDISEMRGDISEMRESINGLHGTVERMGERLETGIADFLTQQERLFNNQTNAILDAINLLKKEDRATNGRVDRVETRVGKLENPGA